MLDTSTPKKAKLKKADSVVTIPVQLLQDLIDHAFNLSRLLEEYEGSLPSSSESVRYIDTNACKAKKLIEEAE